jgi:hypothetical protein
MKVDYTTLSQFPVPVRKAFAKKFSEAVGVSTSESGARAVAGKRCSHECEHGTLRACATLAKAEGSGFQAHLG